MTGCVACEEPITNPVCSGCLANSIGQWLREKGLEVELAVPGEGSQDSCIKCNKKMDLCTYCYTEHVYEQLKEKGVAPAKIVDFLYFFHFDLEKKGFLEDAKKLGYSI